MTIDALQVVHATVGSQLVRYRVTRCAGAKTTNILPKKAQITKYSPPKKRYRIKKSAS